MRVCAFVLYRHLCNSLIEMATLHKTYKNLNYEAQWIKIAITCSHKKNVLLEHTRWINVGCMVMDLYDKNKWWYEHTNLWITIVSCFLLYDYRFCENRWSRRKILKTIDLWYGGSLLQLEWLVVSGMKHSEVEDRYMEEAITVLRGLVWVNIKCFNVHPSLEI